MSIEMLQELARAPLPRYFSIAEDIDQILVCQALGFVEAQIPTNIRDAGPARVIRIKPEGYHALAVYFRESERGAL